MSLIISRKKLTDIFWMFMPISGILYLIRFPTISIYIFDLWFLILLLFFRGKIQKVQVFLLALFVSVVSFNTFINISIQGIYLDNFLSTLYRYTQFFVVGSLLINYIREQDQIPRWLLHSFLISTYLCLGYNFIYYFVDIERIIVFNRASSFLENPNNFGGYICIVTPLIFLVFRQIKRFSLELISYFLVLFSLITAGSNSYWILTISSFFMAVIFYCWTRYGSMKTIYFLIILSFLFSIGFHYSKGARIDLKSKFLGINRTILLVNTVLSGGDIKSLGSGKLRDDLNKMVLQGIQSKPTLIFSGVGLGQSQVAIRKQIGTNLSPHNMFIVVFFEVGIIGSFLLLILLISLLKDTGLNIFTVTSLMAYACAMMATPQLYLPFFWTPIIALFGYSACLKTESHSSLTPSK